MKAFLKKAALSSLVGLAAISSLAQGATLSVDKHLSRLEVAVHAPPDSFVAPLAVYDISVSLNPAGTLPETAEVSFAFADLKTGKDARDKKMLEWLQSGQFPSGRFVLESLTNDARGKLLAAGTLTLHGVARPLSFPVTVASEGTRMKIDGEATVDTRDFGLPVIRMFALLKVDPQVIVRFHLEGSHE